MEAVEAAQQNSPRVEDSLARLNYHLDSEAAVNEQINHEYTMSYVYHAMSNYFSRDNVGEMPTFLFPLITHASEPHTFDWMRMTADRRVVT